MADRMNTQEQLASDCVYDCLCSGCEDNGLQIEAQVFCKDCLRYYCENCIVLHSQLFKKHIVMGSANRSDWPIANVTLGYITQCEQHPEEKIMMFCTGHRKLCCIYCLHSDHRICEQVVRIEEAAKGIHAIEDLQELSENILAKCEKFNSEDICMKMQLVTLQASYDDTLLEIASFQKKMTDVIEKLGQTSTSELKTMFTSINETCNIEIQRHVEITRRYKLLQRGLESIKQDNKQLAFILCKKYDELSKETDFLYERKENREINFRLLAEDSMLQLVSELGSLGKIQTYRHKPNQVIQVLDWTNHIIEYEEGNFPESKTATVIGICELADSSFIIADSSNNKAKLLNDSFKVLSDLSLPNRPKQMCNVGAYSVAVIYEFNFCLHFIRVNNKHMTIERIVYTNDICSGIGYHNNDLYFTNNRAIDHCNISGRKMKRLISVKDGM